MPIGAPAQRWMLPCFLGLDQSWVWAYYMRMAVTTVKSTYALDVETVRALEDMARRWRTSKSEALRRAIRAAAAQAAPEALEAIQALDALQESLRLTRTRAESWEREARTERRASSRRREPRK